MKTETNSNWAQQTKKNTQRLGKWTIAWVLSVALATFGPIFLWQSATLSIIAIGLNLILGIGMIVANKIYLDGLDELQKRIQLEAMALTLGVGLVCGIAYTILDVVNVIAQDAEISYLIILLGITYLIGITIGQLRYR